jgi:hypothetical protein
MEKNQISTITYSSKMNFVETQWHQIKTHELAGHIFEDEYDACDRYYQ